MTEKLPAHFLDRIVNLAGPAILVTRNNVQLATRLQDATPELEWEVLTKHDARGWSARRLVSFLR